MNKVEKFWTTHKDTIKNTIIVVTVPLLALSLYGVNRMNKIIDENNLNDLFYGDPDEEEA